MEEGRKIMTDESKTATLDQAIPAAEDAWRALTSEHDSLGGVWVGAPGERTVSDETVAALLTVKARVIDKAVREGRCRGWCSELSMVLHRLFPEGPEPDGTANPVWRDTDGCDCRGYTLDGFNADGYDRQGYDREGYDASGYHRVTRLNRAGFNTSGYDGDGFNQQGLNREGYDRDELDWRGKRQADYDANGFDSDGFMRTGLDRNGRDAEGYDFQGFHAETRRDREGYDRYGVDANGFNRHGLDSGGFNRGGINRYGERRRSR
jgi:hypothetical protein